MVDLGRKFLNGLLLVQATQVDARSGYTIEYGVVVRPPVDQEQYSGRSKGEADNERRDEYGTP